MALVAGDELLELIGDRVDLGFAIEQLLELALALLDVGLQLTVFVLKFAVLALQLLLGVLELLVLLA